MARDGRRHVWHAAQRWQLGLRKCEGGLAMGRDVGTLRVFYQHPMQFVGPSLLQFRLLRPC